MMTQPPAVQQADASNQTDSLPASSDEESTSNELEEAEESAAVDLSGLELLSAASIEQIERLVRNTRSAKKVPGFYF